MLFQLSRLDCGIKHDVPVGLLSNPTRLTTLGNVTLMMGYAKLLEIFTKIVANWLDDRRKVGVANAFSVWVIIQLEIALGR